MDLLIGDPAVILHPVQLMGYEIKYLEKLLYHPADSDSKKFRAGVLLSVIMTVSAALVTAFVLICAYIIHPLAGMLIEAVMGWQCISVRSMAKAADKVSHALDTEGMDEIRYALSMIVGRDTEKLEREGIIKAAVESVAESTTDGIISPLFYLAIGGPVLAMTFKSISTMDSMIGYKNERYLYFGRAGAKMDDAANFIPARLGARLSILACTFSKELSRIDAARIYKRDRGNHPSPNSGQTMSVYAGALGILLGGDAYYGGRLVKKKTFGDDKRKPERCDIKKAVKLMYITSVIFVMMIFLVMAALLAVWRVI